MILYHGSPKKLKLITPQEARGIEKFENKKAIFLCKTFKHAALYALGKTLNGKTAFAITPNRIIIINKTIPKEGYVYKVYVDAKKEKREQYTYDRPIKKFKVYKILPKDYKDKFVYVKDMRELSKYTK